MTETIYGLCCLEVYNAFNGEVTGKIRNALQNNQSNFIAIELTSYVNYCVRLLQNNGWDVNANVENTYLFMWRACPESVLTLQGYSNCRGQWNVVNGVFYLNIYF